MQAIRAAALRRAWRKKLCAHPELEKEYHLDTPTGDYVCTTCGKTFTAKEARQWRKLKKNR
jgi:transposase-like protein